MKRYTLYLNEETVEKVKKLANEKKRSVSFMVSELLESAIKEKTRKREKSK